MDYHVDDLTTHNCRRVANKERCKHGLRYEVCGYCQALESQRDYRVPIERVDPDTGKVTTMWLRGTTTDTHYRRYR